MIKVFFTSWHYQTPEMFLSILKRLTPKCSGTWKNITAVLDPKEADYYIICDGTNIPLPDPANKSVYLGNHPLGMATYLSWSDKPALLRLTLDRHLNNLEMWLQHDYDYLSSLVSPVKTKELTCICTGHNYLAIGSVDPRMYIKRMEFLEAYCAKYSNLSIYGRPSKNYVERKILHPFYRGELGPPNPDGTKGEHLAGKEVVLLDSKYSIEMDVGPTVNYLSERLVDSLMTWNLPFYFGSTNIGEYLPKGSFVPINTSNLSDVDLVYNTIASGFREQNLKAIEEARYLILNKYQTFAYAHCVINNLDHFKAGRTIRELK